MRSNPYASTAPTRLLAFDSETWLIQPGLLSPPLVCGSFAWPTSDGGDDYILHDKEETLDIVRNALRGHELLVGQNIAFDFGVLCARDPSLIPLVFEKYARGEVFDTLLAEQLIRIHQGTLSEGGGVSLADLGKKYLGVDMSEDKHGADAWRMRYHELDGIPLELWPNEARDYPIRDARYTLQIAQRQIADGRNLWDLPEQAETAWVLHLASMWGIRTDKPWVDEFTAKVTAEHTRSRARFLAAGLLKVRRCVKKDGVLETPDVIDRDALRVAKEIASEKAPGTYALLAKAEADLNAGRPMRYGTDKKALEALVSEAYNGNPPVSSKGNIRTNKDALWESGNTLLEEFADAQEGEKYFTTYLKVLQQGTKTPINPRFNTLVETGRTSCSKPNLQNVPRGGALGNPREAFVSREGMVFCSLDYPAFELSMLAHALEHFGLRSRMADAIRAKQDLHVRLAAQIKNTTYEAAYAAVKKQEKWATDFRQMAKAANFGLPGGLGPAKLVTYARQSYDARFCLLSGQAPVCGVEKHFDKRSKTFVCKACFEIAQGLKESWFETWPEMNSVDGYFALVNSWTRDEVITVQNDEGEWEDIRVGSVEQLISGRVRGRCNFTNGANTVFQGLAADVAKRALRLVARECYTDPKSPLWGSRIVVFIHDELFMELPEGRAQAAAFRAAELMNQAFHEYCPNLPCDVRPALMRRWFKKAEEVYDANGRLMPWEAGVKYTHTAEGRLVVPAGVVVCR